MCVCDCVCVPVRVHACMSRGTCLCVFFLSRLDVKSRGRSRSRTFLPVFCPCGVGPAAIVTCCYGRESPVAGPR